MHRLIALMALAAGCSPTSYAYSATTKGQAPRQPGPNGCEFKILMAPPEEPFEEIGTFKHYNGAVPRKEPELRKALEPLVCEVGAHAVVVTVDDKGEYRTAMAIKFGQGFHL